MRQRGARQRGALETHKHTTHPNNESGRYGGSIHEIVWRLHANSSHTHTLLRHHLRLPTHHAKTVYMGMAACSPKTRTEISMDGAPASNHVAIRSSDATKNVPIRSESSPNARCAPDFPKPSNQSAGMLDESVIPPPFHVQLTRALRPCRAQLHGSADPQSSPAWDEQSKTTANIRTLHLTSRTSETRKDVET